MEELGHAIAMLVKLGVKLALLAVLAFYGTCYVFVGASDGCWNPMGCIPPNIEHVTYADLAAKGQCLPGVC